jgi:hypothetical protein
MTGMRSPWLDYQKDLCCVNQSCRSFLTDILLFDARPTAESPSLELGCTPSRSRKLFDPLLYRSGSGGVIISPKAQSVRKSPPNHKPLTPRFLAGERAKAGNFDMDPDSGRIEAQRGGGSPSMFLRHPE